MNLWNLKCSWANKSPKKELLHVSQSSEQLKHTHTHIHTREKLGLLSKQSIHIRKLFPPKTDMNERTTKK